LIHFYQFGEWELYDLENDPDELTNLYSNPAYRDTIAELRAELKRLQVVYQDDSDMSEMPAEWKQKYRKQ
jgi:arylsulfatase A-like enzyme